ncbi:Spo11/DNA topoisomerase VI subunit A [Halteromyces radiatus]|uniref:Spo11/DNA topoisomerase VI subunit A n=1 Tax=Halteromyces radiatus TaxID=101107 RepID=UPI00221FB55A|nr:Spo11/DNA topoisomerase VI subunit A [Halteromyces radiatus]KAI8097386.1 Spo11/DNA topoisomerase VI subunit A [Halteromyces radiatus]
MDSASSFSSPSMDFAYLDSLDFQQQYQPSFPSSQGSHRTIYQSRDSVMASIENTILEIFESLSKTKPVELQVLSRTLNRRQVNASSLPSSDLPTGSDGPLYTGEPRMKSLSLNTTASATSLTRYVRVLEIVYEALANNIMVTKRDIFYRDVPLFKTQPIVDKIVDDICCHYNVPRSCLNVSASGKGRIFGPANIILKNHRVLNCMSSPNGNSDDCNDEQGTLIPPISQILDVECRAQLLVVIEKEASFRHLVSVGFVQRLLHRCVLITGCGYPDFATRHMVKHLSTRYPRMPVLAVMDNDPYGLDIYSVYKWGSMAQAHDSVNLTIPSMKFLGLEYADRKKYQIPDIAYTPLTMKDREKGIRMIQSAQQLQSNATTEYKQFILEVCKILHRNQKCELQALCSDGPLGFIEYLQLKLEAQLDTIFVY